MLILLLSVMSTFVSNIGSYFLLNPQVPWASIKPSVIQLWQFFHPANHATWKLIPVSRKLYLTSKLCSGTVLAPAKKVCLDILEILLFITYGSTNTILDTENNKAEMLWTLSLFFFSLGKADMPHTNCWWPNWQVLYVWRG